MKVSEVMTTEVISVDKDVNLNHVLKLMKKHDITKIPVVENKKLIGLVTDNTIAYKLGSIRKRDISTSRLHASSVMEKELKTVSPNTDITTILRMVGKPGPTMLPILEKNHLVGVLTKADLLPLVTSQKTLRSIMKKQIHVVTPDDRVIHARRIMIDENIARLPVVDQGNLVGIISDIEIVYAFASLKKSFSLGHQKHHLEELLVRDVMKSRVVWTTPSITAAEAAKIMIKHDVGALPIIDDDDLVGIVSRTDLIGTVSL